jgi:type IV pilus assembly protein PilM
MGKRMKLKKSWRWPKWMNLNAIKAAACVGVDLGTSSVKMVELKRVDKKLKVVGFALASYPKGAWSDDGVQNMDAVVATIQKCWEKLNTSTRNAAIAIPPHDSIIKSFRMTGGLNREQQNMSAEKDVESQLPFSIDQAVWDWNGTLPTQDEESFDVSWGAALKDVMQERMGLVEAAGLKVIVAENEAFAVARIHAHQRKNETAVMCVDVGEKMLNLSVLHQGKVLWVREMSFYRKQFDDAWQAKLGLDDRAFHEGRKTKELAFVQASEDLVRQLAEDVQRGAMEYHPGEESQVIQAVLLYGGGAGLPNVVDRIEEVMMKPVSLWDPMDSLGTEVKVAHKMNDASYAFATAAGLALRTFDDAVHVSEVRK